MPKLPTIPLPIALKERLAQGHPWVYRNHLPAHLQHPSGTWVKATCGNWSGFGLWDDNGPIAIRIFSERQLPDRRWLREQVEFAWQLRSPLREKGCTAYRWLFGEGDGLPGITVDLYGGYAVVQTYMESAEALLRDLIAALTDTADLKGIYLRTQHKSHDAEAATDEKVELIWGEPVPPRLIVSEYGLAFKVNLQRGQKTGLFLDHRENRRFIEQWSRDRDVLNCFCYTGAFSLYALRGGARSVISVDIGKGLAESAAANIALNQLDGDRHTFMTQDCFTLLNQFVEEGRTFDLVILDPPSFAKNKQNRHAAQRAYVKLNALALRCVAPGGWLATASCTSQVSVDAFKEAIAAAAAQAKRRVQIIHEAGQPFDHPVPAHFPEGRYLKFVVGRVR